MQDREGSAGPRAAPDFRSVRGLEVLPGIEPPFGAFEVPRVPTRPPARDDRLIRAVENVNVHGLVNDQGLLSFRSVARNLGARVAPQRPSAAHPPRFLATLRNDKPAARVVSASAARSGLCRQLRNRSWESKRSRRTSRESPRTWRSVFASRGGSRAHADHGGRACGITSPSHAARCSRAPGPDDRALRGSLIASFLPAVSPR
jgi:hypothetical protein